MKIWGDLPSFEPEGAGMASNAEASQPAPPQLGLWDAVSIIIGIVIGTSIYVTPSFINAHLHSPTEVMVLWTIGGILCLIGALCYAELGTAYPRMGGDYVYLTKAFGPWFGFQFGWAQLAVILTASIGMMGFAFGDYAVKLMGMSESEAAPPIKVTLAVLAVAGLTAINILGVVFGKHTQNVLTLTKVIGLGGIVVAGLVYGKPDGAWAAGKATESLPSYGTALILVLYAYGGWNDAAFVAAEMRNKRHIPTTLLLGTGGVMVIYLLINAAYIQALGFSATQGFNPSPIAARTAGTMGEWAAKSISLLVMISALGAINGLLFAGSRVCSALGNEYSVFAGLGRWHPKFGSPVWSLSAMAAIGIAMILGVGTEIGQGLIDSTLGLAHLGPMPWKKYFGGFDTLFAGTAPVFWFFFLLTGLALFVLRENDKTTKRPFLVPLYPYTPTIFCAMCLFGLYSALAYAGLVALIGLVPLLIGVPLYAVSRYTPQLAEGEKPAEAPKSETPPWLAEQPAAPPLQEPPTVEERVQPTPNEPVVVPPPITDSAAPPVPAAAPPAAEEPPAEDNPFSFRK
jgi:APA family basic amino acid/polyamine antiporter